MSSSAHPPHAHQWTNTLPDTIEEYQIFLTFICNAFNHSPFLAHNQMVMTIEDMRIKCRIDMSKHLIGNVAFQILHGGVAATMLDSIGGIVAMAEIFKRNEGERADQHKKIGRLATIDMRVDYLSAGRGHYFIASAQVLRMGRKSCTMRMDLHNDDDKLIATAIASYGY